MHGAFSFKRHILFDLDGTLADSSPVHARVFVEALKTSHSDLAARFEYASHAGKTTRQVFFDLGIRGELELADLTCRKQQLYRNAVENGEVPLFTGAKPLLTQLSRSGRRLFLVTSASRISAMRVMEATGINHNFEGITTAEDVRSGKPSPEPYLRALAAYHLSAAESLAIEDGESGVRSAQGAGLDVVVINTDLQSPGVLNAGTCENLISLLLP